MRRAWPALIAIAFSVGAWGQHGSVGGAIGRPTGGGFAARSFSRPAGGPVSSGPRTFSGAPVYRPNQAAPQQHSYQYQSPIGSAPFGGAYPGGVPPAGGYQDRGGNHSHSDRGYRPYSYASGVYAVPGWLGSGFYGAGYGYGYPDTSGYSEDPQQGAGQGYEGSAAAGYDQGYGEGYDRGYDQGHTVPPARPEYRPDAVVPSVPSVAPPTQAVAPQAAELKGQPQVTLLFKDGRPSQQVQNYALTRTTLYVLDGLRRRDIPLEELDLPGTEEANREAGIDFAVPAVAN